MGFALSHAAGASSDALQKLLTRKFLEQIQTQRLNEDARQADMRNVMDTKQLEATEGLRRDTLAATQQYRDEINKDRDAARELQGEQKFQGRLKLLPTGSRISGQQAVEFAKYGASPLLKPAMTTTGEPEFEYKGTQDAGEAAARAAETQRFHDLTNAAAAARLEEAQRYHNLLNEVAAGRLSNAQMQTELTRIRTEQGGQPQIFTGADGKPRAFRFGPQGATEVPLPDDIVSKGSTSAQPVIFTGADGKPHAIQFGPNGATEVPLPGDLTGKAGTVKPETPGLTDWLLNTLGATTPAAAPTPTRPAARPPARPATPQEYDWVNGKLVPRKAK